MVLWFLMYKDKKEIPNEIRNEIIVFHQMEENSKKKHFYCYNHGFRTLDTNVTHTKLNIGTCFSTSIIWQ